MNETSPASNAPPTHLVSDYIEIAYLAMVLIIGVPINLHVLFKLFRQKDKTATMSMRRGFVLLKINLNISDTLILCINNSGKLFWLTTYEWIAGETMCQVFKYLSVASLYLSSNIVVCIAIDRLWTVLHAEQFRREKHFISTRLILIIAWSLALVTSLPQLGAFRLFNVTQDSNEVWYQCTDIWSVYEYETEVLQKNKSTSFIYSDITKNIHELSHLFLVFFGPLIVMAIAYIIIAVKLTNYSKGQMQLHGNSSTCNGHADNQNLLHSNSVRSSKVPSKQSRSASDATTTILTQKPPIPGATTLDHGHPQLEAQSSLSRRSITESHKSSKSTMLTCTSFLKEEFSYCVCCNDEIDDERQARTKKISTKSVIYDDGASQSSIGNGGPLFTWTPVVPSRKNHSLPHMDNNGMSALIAKAAESDSLPPKRRSSVIARDFFYKITHKNNHNGSTSRRLSDLATPKQPAWRRQLRSRVFKTTLLVVVTHIIFWLPYNVISLLRFVSKDLHARMGQHMNIFEDMQFLIAIVNPFLYGFGESVSH